MRHQVCTPLTLLASEKRVKPQDILPCICEVWRICKLHTLGMLLGMQGVPVVVPLTCSCA